MFFYISGPKNCANAPPLGRATEANALRGGGGTLAWFDFKNSIDGKYKATAIVYEVLVLMYTFLKD